MAQQADVRVLQPVPTFPLLRPLPAWARAPAHTHHGVKIEHARMFYVPGLFKSLDSRWLARSIQRAVSQARSRGALDLLDAHFGYPDGVGCVRVGQRLGVPVFVTLRGLEVDILQAPALRSQLLDALHAAAGCISVSHSLKDLMVSHGIAAAKIAVIPNAIDSDAFRPGDRAAARSRLGLSADRPLIVSVGNLLRVKRHDVLIRAVHELRARHPDVQLAIIGAATHEPETPQALRDLCRQL
ncbi:MAG TPA: glycosyltransferase, partial [Steroidobacteraceae bacterium]|nr:glycosyltransferase [Steroidobacteraceae bacterium]